MLLLTSIVGTRGYRYKIAHVSLSLECRRHFFGLIISIWKGRSDHLVTSNCVSGSKAGLHESLRDLLFQYVD